jgi:hypothetical protein
VAPLARDPAIQQAIADQVTAQVLTHLDVPGLTNQVVRAVQSDAFADAWTQANRVAHDELVKALTGEGGGAVTVEGDTVSLDLAPIIAVVKQRLVDSGFALAARVPEVDASFVLFQSEDITRARSAFNLLKPSGTGSR